MIKNKINISPEFKNLIPALTETEKSQLEANILAEGCRDPLVAWNSILIDGHNRYEICTRNGLEFSVVEKEFKDEEEAKDWMDANQLGRRNLSPDAFRLLLGRRYNRTKKAIPNEAGTNQHCEVKAQNGPCQTTAEKLAEQHGVSKNTVKRAGQLAEAAEKLDMEAEITSGEVKAPQKAIVDAAKSLPDNPTQEEVKEAKKHVHVSQNSGENEWYTPPEFIEAARIAMKRIDLDPASSAVANERVKAARFFTKDDDGLSQEWEGNVWMNPPYAQPLISEFAQKLVEEKTIENISQAIVLVNNATETKWFQTMAKAASAICFPKGRIRYYSPDGKQGKTPLQGQALLYFGSNEYVFEEEFKRFGTVFFSPEFD